jgi:hypothetical protein
MIGLIQLYSNNEVEKRKEGGGQFPPLCKDFSPDFQGERKKKSRVSNPDALEGLKPEF